jgi:Kef-type K+ transport system membrane component KefB
MYFLPEFPIHITPLALLGLTLLLGLIGGELARYSHFLPRVSGYILAGFLVGHGGMNIVDSSLFADTRIFIDISLGLVLFELGRHLDIAWLRHDRGLLPMSITESGLTLILVFSALSMANIPWLPAALAATIAMASSPAVILIIANDLSAQGPVTRRTLILTSLNNLFALLLFALLLPMTSAHLFTWPIIIAHSLYRLFGSLILGLILFAVAELLACLTGKYKKSQFILFITIVIMAISLAQAFNLSMMLTLFTVGAAARNLDRRHLLIEIDFGWIAHLFFVLLFVVSGAYLQLQGLRQAACLVFTLIFIRLVAKFSGIILFGAQSRLTSQQVFAISLALTPMAGVTIGMSAKLMDFNPDLGNFLTSIIAAAAAILHIFAPIATQYAFVKTNEATPNSN